MLLFNCYEEQKISENQPNQLNQWSKKNKKELIINIK
jgi:hypothetical protein